MNELCLVSGDLIIFGFKRSPLSGLSVCLSVWHVMLFKRHITWNTLFTALEHPNTIGVLMLILLQFIILRSSVFFVENIKMDKINCVYCLFVFNLIFFNYFNYPDVIRPDRKFFLLGWSHVISSHTNDSIIDWMN